jgi:predicted nucleic acid-binding protein
MGALAALLARLRGERVYFDANALIYFFDRRERYFDVVAPLFAACDAGDFLGYTGDAAVSEVMVHPYRSNEPEEIARGKALFTRENFLTVLSHDARAFDLATQLRARARLRMIDALQYATALNAGCRFMISNDTDFKPSNALEVVRIDSLLHTGAR